MQIDIKNGMLFFLEKKKIRNVIRKYSTAGKERKEISGNVLFLIQCSQPVIEHHNYY